MISLGSLFSRQPAPLLGLDVSTSAVKLVELGRDKAGNLVYRKTARNFNVPVATCGKVCVVEVEEIVEPGSLDPDGIHLPGVYVHRIICGAPYDKPIEFRTTRKRENA